MNDISRVIVSEETGECVGHLLPGDKVIHQKYIDKIQSANESKMPFSNGEWGKAYSESMDRLACLKLTGAEYSIVLLFLPLVRLSSGLVAYGNYRPVKTDWICQKVGISPKTATRALKHLADLRVISQDYSGGETIYFFNPFIYHKGRYINKTLYEMFRKSQWAQSRKK